MNKREARAQSNLRHIGVLMVVGATQRDRTPNQTRSDHVQPRHCTWRRKLLLDSFETAARSLAVEAVTEDPAEAALFTVTTHTESAFSGW